jgi:hypothetical protein
MSAKELPAVDDTLLARPGDRSADPPGGPGAGGLEQLLLQRLERLAALRKTNYLLHDYPAPARLTEHALFSTYQDCVRLGLEGQARRILGLPES